MIKNKHAEWDWSVYFDNVHDPDMRETLRIALEHLGTGAGRQAVDIGCGSGNDTVHMLEAGFNVLAIDQSAEGLKRLVSRETIINHCNLKVLESSFEAMALPKSAFLNASFALPFCEESAFQTVWGKVIEALDVGGVFAGHLFGVEDSWNGKVSDMTFLKPLDVKNLLQSLEFIYFNEIKKDGTDAVGRPKYWHFFEIVVRKK